MQKATECFPPKRKKKNLKVFFFSRRLALPFIIIISLSGDANYAIEGRKYKMYALQNPIAIHYGNSTQTHSNELNNQAKKKFPSNQTLHLIRPPHTSINSVEPMHIIYQIMPNIMTLHHPILNLDQLIP